MRSAPGIPRRDALAVQLRLSSARVQESSMSETLLAALIGLAGSIIAAAIGAYVTLRIHASQTAAARPVEERATRTRNALAIPFTAVSVLLAVMFAVFLLQELRPGAAPPTATPVLTQVALGASPTILPTATLLVATPSPVPSARPPSATAEAAGFTPTLPPTAPAASPTAPPVAVSPTGAATATPAAGPTTEPGVYGSGQRAELAPGVYLTIRQMTVANGSFNWQG